ncbi:MAG: SAM-dependent methyltransferase [Alphaproteobacteria bacterium]|nr:SAM-dependent methyltransferase [Alphaproteobacteria bacterium]
MAMALHDPDAGYYARGDPIGASGDFTTAPEISQIFGELIGLWCAELWDRIGRPDPVILAELGPGRGVLMSDLLRAADGLPEFRRALRIFLVEASPALRTEQQQRLCRERPEWVSRVEDIPGGPMLLVANEFLDALPIRQFVRGPDGWSERMVGLDPEDRLVFMDGPTNPFAKLIVPEGLRGGQSGAIAEICPAALALASGLGARFAREPGAALFIDYGYFGAASGPTLRAVQRHRAVPALAAPGTADISAHVDFAAFAEAARTVGAEVHGPVGQRRFLTALGVRLRLAVLGAQAAPAERQALEIGVRRLLDPGEMGDVFKAMALASPGLLAPAGFAPSVDKGEPAGDDHP